MGSTMTKRRYKQIENVDNIITALTIDDYEHQNSSPRNEIQIKNEQQLSSLRLKVRPVRRHGHVLIIIISIFVIIGIVYYNTIIIVGRNDAARRKPKFSVSYTPPATSIAFLTAYEKVMSKANLSPPRPYEAYIIPLLLENNTLYCRNSHKDVIMKARIYSYITMLTRSGESSGTFVGRAKQRMKNSFTTYIFHNNNNNNNSNNNNEDAATTTASLLLNESLPIILIESDTSGCYHHNHPHLSHWLHNNPHFVTTNTSESLLSSSDPDTTTTTNRRSFQYYSINKNIDTLSFPRLTWHTPALKYNPSTWCSAIDMPGYERYSLLSDRSFMIYNNNWESTFHYHEYYYPWLKKVDMAIWRGSTTGPHSITFNELPRTQLVQISLTRPDIINAKFTSFVQGREHEQDKYDGDNSTTVLNQTVFDIAKYMPYNELMQYRAIIDIDGNTWSSRFTKLLCTNSVIIKVCYVCNSYRYILISRRLLSFKTTVYPPLHGPLQRLILIILNIITMIYDQ